ncbi:TonB-dependent receptor [Sphingomonas sp.]|uniref:TonB-dependent receptor n=1 Tax=Sphingomonas sp. TaxID=28214 RepID=UPI0025F35F80|nr:TonB-dependent receptor [Sphingomonas sp.]
MKTRRTLIAAFFATTMLASTPAFAQTPADTPEPGLGDDIIVTAQKREENIQNVPISIQALGTRKLDQLNVADFKDYAALLPSVTFQASTPGSTKVYMRGVASGGDGNHSGSLPSVGIYLDEQPVTTIDGAIDIHIYDIARIESLSGPQGTLYGASSEAGTIRIITNKPSTAGIEARVDVEGESVAHGKLGGKVEGMINLPITENAAIRAVGWYQHDAGFIDNVPGTRSFLPVPGGITVNNAAVVKNNINDVDTAGGRLALKIDLDDNWTVTPTIMGQDQRSHGRFGYDATLGDLKVQTFYPERNHDRFIQGALTIAGKVGNFDLTYAGAYLERKVNSVTDYTDYAEAYDRAYAADGGNAGFFSFIDDAGNTIDPRQRIVAYDKFTKLSQELRVASPQDARFRVVAGLFYQRQTHFIFQDYKVANLAANRSVNGLPGTLWLTEQDRVDADYAVFGEASFDILPNLTLTAGGRGFIYDNSLYGFNGFGLPSAVGGPGVGRCFRDAAGNLVTQGAVAQSPCTNVGTQIFDNNGNATTTIVPKRASGQGFTHKVNLTWKPAEDILLYGTWSRGFRPGGINRRAGLDPYGADFLTNYEIGFKTSFFDRKLRINGAVFRQDWKAFQFAFLGQFSLTQIQNGPDARIKGVEADINWQAFPGLTLTASGAYTDAKTRTTLCSSTDAVPNCGTPGNSVTAPKGTSLPITPKLKISGIARYTWDMGEAKPYVQALVAHQSSAPSALRTADQLALGQLTAFTTAAFNLGAEFGKYSAELFVENAFDERGQLSRYQQCSICTKRTYIVPVTPRTIGFRLGAKF